MDDKKSPVSWRANQVFFGAAVVSMLLFMGTFYYFVFRFMWELAPLW